MDSDEDQSALDFLLDEARRLQSELNQTTEILEKKGIEISKSVLTIIGFFIAITVFIFSNSGNITNIEWVGIASLVSLVFFIIAFGLAQWSNGIKTSQLVYLEKLIKRHKEYDFSFKKQKQNLLTAFNVSQKSIIEMNNYKARFIEYSTYSVLFGLVMGVTFVFLLLININ